MNKWNMAQWNQNSAEGAKRTRGNLNWMGLNWITKRQVTLAQKNGANLPADRVPWHSSQNWSSRTYGFTSTCNPSWIHLSFNCQRLSLVSDAIQFQYSTLGNNQNSSQWISGAKKKKKVTAIFGRINIGIEFDCFHLLIHRNASEIWRGWNLLKQLKLNFWMVIELNWMVTQVNWKTAFKMPKDA